MEQKRKKREAMEAERRKKNPGSAKSREPPPQSVSVGRNNVPAHGQSAIA